MKRNSSGEENEEEDTTDDEAYVEEGIVVPILRSRPKTQSGCEEKKVTVVPALIRASFR